MKIDFITVGAFMENTYFLIDENKNECIIVDPGGSGAEIADYLQKNGLKVDRVINTHGHPDHVEANEFLKQKYGMPILIHPEDAETFNVSYDEPLKDGDVIGFAGEKLNVFLTPGHTMGGICIMGDGYMLTGDTLFAGSIGRTDIGGDPRVMEETLAKRFDHVPGDTVLYPGHGPKTTMNRERGTNPFLLSVARKG